VKAGAATVSAIADAVQRAERDYEGGLMEVDPVTQLTPLSVTKREVTVEWARAKTHAWVVRAIQILELPGGENVDSGTEHQIVARAVKASCGRVGVDSGRVCHENAPVLPD
jgi:hypothetical protein